MDISYELYKVFYYVASTLSFSEASRLLYISQSAVSQSIRTLEQKLEKLLFIRSTKKVALTPEGELLFRHIEPAIHMIQTGETQLTEEGTPKGQLRIGASDTICRYFLVPYLNRFHKEYPHIHIRVTNQTSIGCVELLESGQVDLIVVNSPNSHLKSRHHQVIIGEFQDIFVANKAYYNVGSHLFTLKELLDYPLLMLERNSTTSEFLHQLFQQKGHRLTPEVELSSNDLLIDLAYIGLGIAFVPDFMLKSAPSDLVVLRTREQLPKRQLLLGYQEQLPLSVGAQRFLEYF